MSLAASLACPSCGADNSSGQKFCNECATPLGKSTSPTQTPTPEPSPALPTSLANGRYEVKGFLGEGARKKVYLAHDDREIMPGMGFTLEPGIYTDTYALRICANLFIDGNRQVNLSAPLQREIIAVLGSAE